MRIWMDISDVDDELTRLMRMGEESSVVLSSVVTQSFTETQMDVHIRTGALHGSGKLDVETSDTDWSGSIEYGGASGVPAHDPVKYAEYERRRGGAHDFIEPAVASDGEYGEVLLDFLKGEL